MKEVAETFTIIQLGLTFFVLEGKKQKAYAFNFYLFPRAPVKGDTRFGMQVSCINFNSENELDWNKWIREGVNYVRISEM